MKKSEKLLDELKRFGCMAVYYHLMYILSKNTKYRTLYFLEKEKKYLKMSKEEIANEICDTYYKYMGHKLNFHAPRKFTEKIQKMKLDDDMIKSQLADKYAVREWIKNQIGDQYLVPILGVWNNVDEINFDKLPEKFCLKLNNGSGMNIIVTDKKNMNLYAIKNKFSWWLKCPFWVNTLEPHYKKIENKIIAEEYISELDNNLLDYKFHCFMGKPVFIQCIGNRDIVNHTAQQAFFDLEWKTLDFTFEDYPMFTNSIQKPNKLNEMIEVAKKLSKNFPYVRVDLYEINNKVLFGEMTFTPHSGIYPYKLSWNIDRDEELGEMIKDY